MKTSFDQSTRTAFNPIETKSVYISKKTGKRKHRICLYLPDEIVKKLDRWTAQNRFTGTPGKSITQLLNALL